MKKKKLPKSVMVLGHKFDIVWNYEFDDDSWGDTDVLGRKIRIGTRCDTADKRASTFTHELLHAIIGISGHDSTLGEKLEEAVVYSLENGLYPVLNVIDTVRRTDK